MDTVTETRTKKTYKLNRHDLVSLLGKKGIKIENLTENLRIYITVPSGGDYSGVSLDIDDDCPLMVELETTTKKEG